MIRMKITRKKINTLLPLEGLVPAARFQVSECWQVALLVHLRKEVDEEKLLSALVNMLYGPGMVRQVFPDMC